MRGGGSQLPDHTFTVSQNRNLLAVPTLVLATANGFLANGLLDSKKYTKEMNAKTNEGIVTQQETYTKGMKVHALRCNRSYRYLAFSLAFRLHIPVIYSAVPLNLEWLQSDGMRIVATFVVISKKTEKKLDLQRPFGHSNRGIYLLITNKLGEIQRYKQCITARVI